MSLRQPSAPGTVDISATDELLAAVLSAFLVDLEAGCAPDPEQIIATHPEIADRLRACLENLRFIEKVGNATNERIRPEEDTHGDRLLGDFILIRELGRGGMGVVYEAEQTSLHRRVALKTLPFAAVLDTRQLQRFKNEAQAAASLHHPHIVGVHAVGCERGVHYYAMDYIEGRSLAEVIAGLRHVTDPERPPFHVTNDPMANTASCCACMTPNNDTQEDLSTVAEQAFQAAKFTKDSARQSEFFHSAARLGIQAAEALDHAHQSGVVHRDIKPSNLLVDTAGQLFVTDFGLAATSANANLTMTGDLLGTIRYMSPEQSSGRRHVLDHRTDIYSLGITLYELLTLRPAYGEEDRQHLLRDIAEREPRAPRTIESAIPRDLETIILKAISKNPEQRYQTADEFTGDLRLFSENKPIRARRIGRVGRTYRWARRKPAVSLLMAAVGLLLLVLAIGGPVMALREREANRQTLMQNYVLSLNAAYTAWEEANIGRVRALLDRQVPRSGQRDSRGFEWFYLDAQLKAIDQITTIHCGRSVSAVDFSPDGQLLASAGAGGHVRLWAKKSNGWMKIAELSCHSDDTTDVAFSPDGQLLAVSSRDGTVSLWDVAKVPSAKVALPLTEPVQRLTGFRSGLYCVAFSPDGRLLATGGIADARQSDVTLCDLQTQERRDFAGHTDHVQSVEFSPDGERLASASHDDTVRIWNVETAECEQLLRRPVDVLAVGFSPNGRVLATAGFAFMRLYDTENWLMQDLMERTGVHPTSVTSLTFSPEGRTLATGGHSNAVQVWDTSIRNLVTTFRGHSSEVTTVKFSPDGKLIASGSKDQTIQFSPAPQQLGAGTLSPETARPPIALSADGKWLAVGNADWQKQTREDRLTTRLYNLPGGTRQVLSDQDYIVFSLAFCPPNCPLGPGNILAIGSRHADLNINQIRFWNTDTGDWMPESEITTDNEPERLVFLPDGQTLAVTAFDSNHVYLYDITTRSTRSLLNAGDATVVYAAITLSPDGSTLLTGLGWIGYHKWNGGNIQVWDMRSGTRWNTISGHRDVVFALAYSPDGRVFASASLDGMIKIWDAQKFTVRHTLSAHSSPIFAVAFSPDGKTLASGGYGRAKLWHVETGEALTTLETGIGVQSLAFTADGTTLAASLADGTVQLWHGSIDKASWPIRLY